MPVKLASFSEEATKARLETLQHLTILQPDSTMYCRTAMTLLWSSTKPCKRKTSKGRLKKQEKPPFVRGLNKLSKRTKFSLINRKRKNEVRKQWKKSSSQRMHKSLKKRCAKLKLPRALLKLKKSERILMLLTNSKAPAGSLSWRNNSRKKKSKN